MKNNKIFLKLMVGATTALLPFVVFADESQQVGILKFDIKNPLLANNFWDLLSNLIDLAMKIGIPVAVVFFMWAGFQYISSGGNEAKVKLARKNLEKVVLGTIIFLGAWTITQVIVATIQAVVGKQ